MKKIFAALLAMAGCIWTLAAGEYVRIANMSIELPENASRVEQLAAGELALHLKAIYSGNASLNGKIPEKITFYVGRSAASDKAGFTGLPAAAELPGKFAVYCNGCDFLLYGEDTPDGRIERLKDKFGTFSAVSYFVQKYLDVKIFMPGEDGIKYSRNVPINFTAESDIPNPSYDVRCFQRIGKGLSLEEGSLFFRRRLGHVPGYAAHDYYYDFIGNWDKRFKHKPEMFALHEGKRVCGNYPRHFPCLSHPDVIPQIVSDVEAAMEKNPKIKTIRFFSDAPVKNCECEKCTNSPAGKLVQGGDSSEIVYSLLCKLARELQKKDPELWFHTHTKGNSYYQVPRTEKLPPNIVIFILTSIFQEPDYQSVKELCDMWSNAGATVMLKAYPRTEWMKDYPIMNPHLIAKFYKMFQGLSKGSIMSEGRPHVPYVFSALNNYVHSAVVFDSSLDTDKLITEFCQLAAPEAAAELEAFYNSMEKLLDGAYFTAEPLRNYYLSFRLKNPSAHLISAAQKAPGNKFVQQLAKDFAAFEKISIAESPGIGSEAELQAIYKSFDRKKAPLKLSSTPDESELLPFSIYYDFQKSSAQISRQGDHIAVTVTCQENNMDKLKAACKKNHNGPVWNDDSVEVFICRPEDSKSYIQLIINSLGVYRVMFCDESGVVTDKPAFNFTARGIKSGDSWQVQMLIPIGDIADMIKNNAVNMGIYRNRPAKNRTEVQQSGIQKPHNNSFKNISGHFRVEL